MTIDNRDLELLARFMVDVVTSSKGYMHLPYHSSHTNGSLEADQSNVTHTE